MSPSEMSIIRLTMRMAVVLPQPDGPTSTQISPAGTSRLRWSTAGRWLPGAVVVGARSPSEAAWGDDNAPGLDAGAGGAARGGVGAALEPVVEWRQRARF